MNTLFDSIVIGAGPAGLAAAYTAKNCGKKVLLIEKMPRPGLKLLASGGGRCNVSNTLELEDFAGKFGRNWRFLLPALSRFHGKTLLDFFRKKGVDLTLPDGFHYFPASGRAGDILQLFLNALSREIICGEKVVSLKYGEDLWEVGTDKNIYRAKEVICACGGRGYPPLGGSMAGYDLIKNLGHTVTPLYPAMTGVVCADPRVGECAGISLNDCVASIALKGNKIPPCRGELLFTHRGFSAFAILDLAGSIAELLAKHGTVPLKIDFLPELSAGELTAEFDLWRKNGGTRKVSHLLGKYLPRKAALLLMDGEDPEISRWKAASSRTLCEKLKGAIFELTGTESWDKAMVTYGGVSLKEVDPHTLASKKFPRLYFAGEMLDVTGPCGGFNITWALASGMTAGAAEL